MRATINGELRELPGEVTVGALLESLGTARTGIAVARNDCIVRRADYDAVAVTDGDRIEIIKAVAVG